MRPYTHCGAPLFLSPPAMTTMAAELNPKDLILGMSSFWFYSCPWPRAAVSPAAVVLRIRASWT